MSASTGQAVDSVVHVPVAGGGVVVGVRGLAVLTVARVSAAPAGAGDGDGDGARDGSGLVVREQPIHEAQATSANGRA